MRRAAIVLRYFNRTFWPYANQCRLREHDSTSGLGNQLVKQKTRPADPANRHIHTNRMLQKTLAELIDAETDHHGGHLG